MFCAGTVLFHNSFIASKQARLLINLSPPDPGRLLTTKPPLTGSEIGPDFDFDTPKKLAEMSKWRRVFIFYFTGKYQVELSGVRKHYEVDRWQPWLLLTGGCVAGQTGLSGVREDGLRGGKKLAGSIMSGEYWAVEFISINKATCREVRVVTRPTRRKGQHSTVQLVFIMLMRNFNGATFPL